MKLDKIVAQALSGDAWAQLATASRGWGKEHVRAGLCLGERTCASSAMVIDAS
jgi:hypothetical protein